MKNEFQIRLNSVNEIALFTQKCSEFDRDIDYQVGRYIIDAKSMMGVLSTGVEKNVTVTINTDEQNVIKEFYDEIKMWIVKEEN